MAGCSHHGWMLSSWLDAVIMAARCHHGWMQCFPEMYSCKNIPKSRVSCYKFPSQLAINSHLVFAINVIPIE